MTSNAERRKYPRLALRLPVALSRAGEPGPLEGVTDNISVGGFYCVLPGRLAEGDRLECTLLMSDGTHLGRAIRWLCRSQVMRVQSAEGGSRFGVGCRIDDYTLIVDSERQEAIHEAAS